MQFTSINVSECSGGYSVTLNGHKLVDAEGKPRVFSSAARMQAKPPSALPQTRSFNRRTTARKRDG